MSEKLNDILPFSGQEIQSTPNLARGNLLGGVAVQAETEKIEKIEEVLPFSGQEIQSAPNLQRGNLLGGVAVQAETEDK